MVLQLLQAEERATQLQGRVRELGVSLEEARSHTREKETLLEEQRRKERELLTTVTRYNQSLAPRGSGRSSSVRGSMI